MFSVTLILLSQRYGILSCLLPNIHIQRPKRAYNDLCVHPSDNNCSSNFSSRVLAIEKRSKLQRHMLKFRSGTVTEADKDELFKQLFMEKMPRQFAWVWLFITRQI